jgi:hypothetical protein
MKTLVSKLRGYYNYYGMIGNYRSLYMFYFKAIGILFKWLNRRSQRTGAVGQLAVLPDAVKRNRDEPEE